jgi:hypothetical protein
MADNSLTGALPCLDLESLAHTLLQQWVPMHSRFQTPIGYMNFFSARPLVLLLLPLVITFLCLHCHSLHSTTTNERTNERTNDQTNERTNER